MIDLWIKSLHVLAIISWMAGLLYLPGSLFITPMCRLAPSRTSSSR